MNNKYLKIKGYTIPPSSEMWKGDGKQLLKIVKFLGRVGGI
jgi:hypothetical protein